MLQLSSVESIYLVLAFIVPGLVTVYVRSRLISGPKPSHAENILTYLVISVVYYALAAPTLTWAISFQGRWASSATLIVVFAVVGPAILGLVIGIWTKEVGGKCLPTGLGSHSFT